tara:strand:- start:16 stop:1371 length:1356 start_codon:yes stop_codon:yes gene_type:complete
MFATGLLPIMGFTTWCQPPVTGCGDLWTGSPFNVSAASIYRVADRLESTQLLAAGFTYILLDDGWPSCDAHNPSGNGACVTQTPRLPNGDVLIDPRKFPPSRKGANDGLNVVADALHGRGIKLGIYTAPGPATCGGYTGIYQHELHDVAQFAAAGIDFIKLDLGCGDATSLHDGTALGSLRRVGAGVKASAHPMIFYVDAGNSNEASIWNPQSRGVVNNSHSRTHVPRNISEEVWEFGPSIGAQMWKIWSDRFDNLASLLGVVHAHTVAGIPFRQRPGAITTLDALTLGRAPTPGSMSDGEHRIELFIYVMFSSPLVLSFDLASGSVPSLLLNKEIIAIDQDPDVVSASLIANTGGRNPWGTDLYIKPLSTGEFAVALINKNQQSVTMHVDMTSQPHGLFSPFTGGPDPGCSRASVRDVVARTELGSFEGSFNATVAAKDARLFRFKFNFL